MTTATATCDDGTTFEIIVGDWHKDGSATYDDTHVRKARPGKSYLKTTEGYRVEMLDDEGRVAIFIDGVPVEAVVDMESLHRPEPVQGIRDIDGERISEMASKVAALADDARWTLQKFTERGIVVKHSWLGSLTVKLGSDAAVKKDEGE